LAIGITGIIQSHIVSLFLTAVFTSVYILLNVQKINRSRSIALLKVVLLTLCFNAWFIIPFFIFMPVAAAPYLNVLSISALYVNQMFATFVLNSGRDLFRMGATQSEMPLTLGGFVFIGILMFICILLFSKDKYFSGLKRMGKSCLVYGAFALLLASTYFPLYALPVFKNIQFPWRFLTIASPLLCMAGSIGLYTILRKTALKKQVITLLIILACIVGSAYQIDSYLQLPTAFANKYETSYKSFMPYKDYNDYTYHGSDSEYPHVYTNKIVTSGEHIKIANYKRHLDRISVSYELQEFSTNNYIEFPLYNFQGYKAELNNDESTSLKIENGTNNFIRVFIPDNKKAGIITVRYAADSWIFKSGNIITGITVILLVFFVVRNRFIKKFF
jgi:hypothetical protein